MANTYEYRITGKAGLRPKLVIKIGGRLFNFGRLGAFERDVPAQKDGTPGYKVKIYTPGQEELQEYFERGMQKLVSKVDVEEEKLFLKKQEDLNTQHAQQLKSSEEVLETQESEKESQIKGYTNNINIWTSEKERVEKSNSSDAEKKRQSDILQQKINAAKISIENLSK